MSNLTAREHQTIPDRPRLRINYLLTQDLNSPTGGGRFFPLARALVARGHTVHLIALHADFASLKQSRFQKDGVDVCYVSQMHVRKTGSLKTYYPPGQLLKIVLLAGWRLHKVAGSIPADIVHICKPHPMNSIAGLMGKYRRHQMVYLDCDDDEVAIGNFSSTWQRAVIQFFESKIPHLADRITTNTFHTATRLTGQGIKPDRVVYLSNGIDPLWFSPPAETEIAALRAKFDLEGKNVVAFIGSLSRPGHPVDLLFESFSLLYQQHREAILLIVGGGDDFDRLQRTAAGLGLENAIRFCGRVSPEDVPIYYRLANLSVDPVLDDAAARGRSPLKLFESWASGVPFITGDVGDRRRLLAEPPAGLLTKPGNPASLFQAMASILENPQLAQEVSQRGLKLAAQYSWDLLAASLEQDYYTSLYG